MKVLVPVKRVVDPYVKIQVSSDQKSIDIQNLKMSMNPFDEIALEETVRWKESQRVNEIVAVSIGPSGCQEILRKALAFGADRAMHIETDLDIEPLSVAKILKAIVEKESIDCVMMGKQAIDDDFNQTGQMLAALLNWPQATFASECQFIDDNKKLEVTREVDGGLEVLSVDVPCVITTDLRLNEPRHLALPNIMKAKKKPLEVVAATDFGLDLSSRLTITQVVPPKGREAGIQVENVDELVTKLRDKEKVI